MATGPEKFKKDIGHYLAAAEESLDNCLRFAKPSNGVITVSVSAVAGLSNIGSQIFYES